MRPILELSSFDIKRFRVTVSKSLSKLIFCKIAVPVFHYFLQVWQVKQLQQFLYGQHHETNFPLQLNIAITLSMFRLSNTTSSVFNLYYIPFYGEHHHEFSPYLTVVFFFFFESIPHCCLELQEAILLFIGI